MVCQFNSAIKRRVTQCPSFLAFTELPAALLNQLGDQAGPSGLMTGAHSGTRVAVEILVKENQVAPMRVHLELFQVAEYRTAAIFVTPLPCVAAACLFFGILGITSITP